MKATLTLFLFVLIGTGSAIFSQTVTIGTQVWMTKNLDVATFRNGDPIPQAKTIEEWMEAGKNEQPAWCYYENDIANGAKYGKLYNWYAVNDSRGLAPSGYHVSTDAEWTKLTDYLELDDTIDVSKSIDINYILGENAAGDKMKSTNGWAENGNGTNESGFFGLPGGGLDSGEFNLIGETGVWWSSTEDDTGNAWCRFLFYDNGFVGRYYGVKKSGFSVRCVKD
jgi:uncharacterized protein (TIGR02145 family)